MGPFSVRLQTAGSPDMDFRAWSQKGDPVSISGRVLAFGKLQIQTARAADWNARPDWLQVQSVLKDRIVFVRGSIARLLGGAPLESLASIGVDMDLAGGVSLAGLGGAIHWAARPMVYRLRRGLRLGIPADLQTGAAGLAGLGPGLTPAGDDFLVGVLLGLWAAWPVLVVPPVVEAIVSAAAPRTTLLSAAWLRAAGRGEADEAWHNLLASLVSSPASGIITAGQRILARGHTSGADALAGFFVALTARCQQFRD
jgi:hypothetical protein